MTSLENQLVEGVDGLGQAYPIGGVNQYSEFFAKRQLPMLSVEHEQAVKSELLYGFPYAAGGLWKSRDIEYYHKVSATTASLKLTFFNVAAQDFVTNMNNGDIPAGRPMWATGITLWALDVDSTGALTSNYAAHSLSASTSMQNTIALAKTLGNGLVRLKINREVEFERLGADRFPRGGGINGNQVVAGGTGFAAGLINNNPQFGDAVAFNMFTFSRPILLIPQRRVELTVDLQSATIPAACSVVATIFGREVVSMSLT